MIKCNTCANLIPNDSEFCPFCGNKVVHIVEESLTQEESLLSIQPDILIKRAFLFLEEGDFDKADNYIEAALNQEPENAEAYLAKLMLDLRVSTVEELSNLEEPFDNNINYKRVLRYGDEKLKDSLVLANNSIVATIEKRKEEERVRQEKERIRKEEERMRKISEEKENTYQEAKQLIDSSEGIYFEEANQKLQTALTLLSKIPEYKNSSILFNECEQAIYYNMACGKMSSGAESNLEGAIEIFEEIIDFKDSKEKIEECKKEIENIKKKNKRNKKIAAVLIPVVSLFIIFLVVYALVVGNREYNDAIALMNDGNYEEAILAFEELGGYNGSTEKVKECKYAIAIDLMNDGKYEEAISAFEELGWYNDSREKIKECEYVIAIDLFNANKIIEAYEALVELDGYKDSAEKAESICNEYKMKTAKVGDYIFFGAYEQDDNTSNGKEPIEWKVLEVNESRILVVSKYVLDCKPYNASGTAVFYESSSIRKWLNNDFLNSAFSADQKKLIPTVTVLADKNPDYTTPQGNATNDKIFLLSIKEVNNYFQYSSDRRCTPTYYADVQGVSSGTCDWWLRTSGAYNDNSTYVYSDGSGIDEYGRYVDNDTKGVRPAMWIDIS